LQLLHGATARQSDALIADGHRELLMHGGEGQRQPGHGTDGKRADLRPRLRYRGDELEQAVERHP
jgi:hypothetical protein